MGIYAVIQVRNPRGDTDFCFAGCHGQTHAAKVTAGRRVRQIVVKILGNLHKVRCRGVHFGSFGSGGFGCLRRCCGILCKSRQCCAQICERNSSRQQQRQALLYSVFVLHTGSPFYPKEKARCAVQRAGLSFGSVFLRGRRSSGLVGSAVFLVSIIELLRRDTGIQTSL